MPFKRTNEEIPRPIWPPLVIYLIPASTPEWLAPETIEEHGFTYRRTGRDPSGWRYERQHLRAVK